jgi:arylsulfatase A-like enzyme
VLDDGYQDDAKEKLGDHQPAGPLRGGKYSVYEGGTRTPFITRWKGHVAPSVSDKMVCTIDLPVSLAALTSAVVPKESCLDSLDVHQALLGKADAAGRTMLLQQDNNGQNFGLRVGDWKYVRLKTRAGNAKNPKNDSRTEEMLFDLKADLGEKRNLASEEHVRLKQMREQLETTLTSKRTRE